MDLKGAKKYILERLENELPDNLYYHGIHHTIDVYESSIKLAEAEKVSQEEKNVIHTAALFHDAGFIHQYENNEILAVELINEVLPSFNYNKKEIETIGNIILTTRIKARPFTLLEKIMCDADYDYLGREDVENIANSLYSELQENGASFNKREWNQIQIKFLNKHEFYTDTAINLRRENKWEYIRYLKGLK
jgi:HD superfamily phosphodiesterase